LSNCLGRFDIAYATSTMSRFRAFETTKQKEGESLHDFTLRIKVPKDVLETHRGSPITLATLLTKMNGYVSEFEKNYPDLANTAFEQYSTYLYLEQRYKNVWKHTKWIEYSILPRQQPVSKINNRSYKCIMQSHILCQL
jgi:hypothetical protein